VPRARCPESIEAEKKYRSGMKLVEIAREMSVPEGTVRRWKSDQDWDGKKAAAKKKETERSDTGKPNARKRKPGGQPGNQNGKGGPPGNVKAATHGAYIQFYKTVLTEEESDLLPLLADQQERDRLQTLYAQHQITERRLMEEIRAIRNGADIISPKTISQVEPAGKKHAERKEITKVVKISQEQVSRKDQLRVFTDALTRVRAEMRRVADSLRQLTETEAKTFVNESTQSLVDAMAEAFERRGGDDADD
jgi:uncharacterized protein YjcR